MSENITMRSDNKGLTVKINFWSMEQYLNQFDTQTARKWIEGTATNARTKKKEHFHSAGQLLSILENWNSDQYKFLTKKC
jgi:hypothetical protein